MRVDPQYMTNVVSALDQTTTTQQQLTEELSTGVSITQLSDNPAAVGQNVSLSASIAAEDQYSQTSSSAQGMLQVADSALGSVVTQLTSAISVATEANNGTENAADEQSFASQLSGIRDEVLSLANTSYMGQYLFSGSLNTQPFTLNTATSPASVTYNGDESVNTVVTPDGQSIALNIPGDQIFMQSGASVLGALNQLIADYSSGSGTAGQVDISQLNTALNYVSQQRVQIDNSLSRLSATATEAQTQSTQLQSAQTNLMQADLAQVSVQLQNSETQQAALTQIFASLSGKSLFDSLQN